MHRLNDRLFGPTLFPVFTLRWQTALSPSLRSFPCGSSSRAPPEVCGNLLTSLHIHIIPLVALRLPRNQHEQLYVHSHCTQLGIGIGVRGTPTRGPYYTDLSLRSIPSDVSPFGPCSRDNHQRDQTNYPIKQHAPSVPLIAVGDRPSSHPPKFLHTLSTKHMT